MEFKAAIMDEAAMRRAVVRMSHEIVEKNKGTSGLALVGIRSRGVPLARLIRDNIFEIENEKVPCGELDISFYRDDMEKKSPAPVVNSLGLGFEVEGMNVVIVDDVLYTGRTVRAAIEALFSAGRPAAIRLAILIDRGHRELPIRADFIGKSIPTSKNEFVKVMIPPFEEETGVALFEK